MSPSISFHATVCSLSSILYVFLFSPVKPPAQKAQVPWSNPADGCLKDGVYATNPTTGLCSPYLQHQPPRSLNLPCGILSSHCEQMILPLLSSLFLLPITATSPPPTSGYELCLWSHGSHVPLGTHGSPSSWSKKLCLQLPFIYLTFQPCWVRKYVLSAQLASYSYG